ncbi:MAG: tetratricopeptide repeat protein [Gammaproteobacteria bacterium]|nr:tetratricopeptide repeat protein [Gammaproteobacteria bacterium]
MARRPGIVAIALALSACASPGPQPLPVAATQLLAPDLLAVRHPTEIVPRSTISELDDAMRDFVARHTRRTDRPRQRLEKLLLGMRDAGLFELEYTNDVTLTARETFHGKRGNCLSFTMLFVALAREAGLDVRFQLVEIPPSWSGSSDYVILNNHINALIRGGHDPDYVVDFNVEEYKGNYATRTVSDDYAVALFYSNRGVEALTAGRHGESFEYFRRAIEAYPDISEPWVNLGVLFSSQEMMDHAEAAYLQGLAANPHNRSALVNLTELYRKRGDDARAAEYAERIRRYQQRNPYYHYSLATAAYESDRPREALELIDKAIRLKKDEHQFHYLRGLAFYELGDIDSARDSLVRARDYAERREVRTRYAAKLSALGG